ncbi:MAG: UPF0755 protein [Parasphingorhabdus sp.]|jgi:UPF0755 protein|tara:strand:- start:2547 stop:3611 length:1065 start_codon:yes stop_codon:yes gene_type:complete
MKSPLRLIALCVLLLTMTAVVLLLLVQKRLEAPVNLGAEVSRVWTVKKGSSLSSVNRQLFAEQIVSHPRLLALYGRLEGRASIQSGSYRILATDNIKTLLAKLNSGDVILHRITFPEGWSFKQWLNHLAKVEQFSSIEDMDLAAMLLAAGIELDHPEGWFFPDTYSYSASDSVLDILSQAHRQMRKLLDSEWQDRDADLPYVRPYDALIMASIIEKETGVGSERPEIAGVFIRRLQRRMRLQTDPTVIYGLGESYRGNLRRRHLKQFTPYNTYMIKGLPPTPIAMPSAAAINAALHPLPGSSLYFVARGDGSHYFSDTLEEHIEAVKEYQIKRRAANYRSSPQKKTTIRDPDAR